MKFPVLFFVGLICCICCSARAIGQYYFYNDDYYDSPLLWHAGFFAGGMNCLTDLGGRTGEGKKFIKDINWSNTDASAGFFIGMVYNDILGARLEVNFGQVLANDDLLKNDMSVARQRYLRNQNFRSQIKELSLSMELYLFAVFDRRNEKVHRINPYVFAGVGCFSFRPETFYNKSWLSLPELHTEGQGFAEYPERKMYKLTQLNMPFGLGASYEASPVLNFKFEVNCRKLWTDYLDDVSKTYIDPALFRQYFSSSKANLAARLADRRWANAGVPAHSPGDIRGNQSNNDSYFSGCVKLIFVLGRQRRQ